MRMISLLLLASVTTVAAAQGTGRSIKSDMEKSADPRDKMICKRFTETGSLVRGYKVCKTKADWDRSREAVRQNTQSGICSRAGDGVSC